MSDNLKIDLVAKTDRDGNKYFVGKLKCDMTLHFKEGQAFLVFVSDEGFEQIQISPLEDKPKTKRWDNKNILEGSAYKDKWTPSENDKFAADETTIVEHRRMIRKPGESI